LYVVGVKIALLGSPFEHDFDAWAAPAGLTFPVNKVLLTGRLTRDPEMRSPSSGKTLTQFSIATNEYIGQGKEKAEYQCKGKV
jgi:hypothetical protein